MSVTGTDIGFYYATTSSPGNSAAQVDPDASLGAHISRTPITDATLSNLFDDVSAAEDAASDVEYRCVFVRNLSAATIESALVWIQSETAGGASIALGLDTVGATAIATGSAQATAVDDESSAPAAVSFSDACVDRANALSIGNLSAGYCIAVWVRRTAANNGSKAGDGVVLRVEGQSD